jgi:hypothetical protein
MTTQQQRKSEQAAAAAVKGASEQALIQLPRSRSVVDGRHAAMMKILKQVRPAFARDIEAADRADQHELNDRGKALRTNLSAVNQEWEVAIKHYNEALCRLSEIPSAEERFAALRQAQTCAEFERARKIHELRSFAPEIADLEEKLDDVMKRCSEIAAQLQRIQEQKDAPLFARMMCAADLIRWGMHTLAAEVLLDLMRISANLNASGGERERTRGEWFLRKIASAHYFKWLDTVIETNPAEAPSYRKLRAAMLLAAMDDTVTGVETMNAIINSPAKVGSETTKDT